MAESETPVTSDGRLVIVCTEHSDVDATRRAKVLVAALRASGHKARYVDKLSSDVDQLLTVARYRLLHTPSWIVVDGAQVLLRMYNIPTPRAAQLVLAQLA